MLSVSSLHGVFVLSLLMASQAHAQPGPAPISSRPDPLDAKASVPGLRYESSFDQYRRLSNEKTVPWRDANDNVARIGGWRVYLREAQPAAPAVSAPAKAAP